MGVVGAAAALFVLLLASCESIDPKLSGPSMTEDSVLLTCEGCHTTRKYLRWLTAEFPMEDAGGGG
jgi:hypothetical protein